MKKNRIFQKSALPLLMGFVSVISIVIGMRLQESLTFDGIIEKKSGEYKNAILEVSEHINSKFYGELNDTTFTDEVISEMIDQLDPYSHYFEKRSNLRYERYMDGLYRGVGIEFIHEHDSIYIYSVIKDSPAETAGIQKGHLLVRLDSIDITDKVSLDSILEHTKKELGTELELTTLDLISKKEESFSVVVGDVEIPMIEDFVLADHSEDRYASYVRIKRFHKDIFVDFMQALENQERDYKKVENLIIDLRDNPGGVVEETVKILNQLISEKDLTLLTTRSNINLSKKYFSNGRTFLDIDKIVLICNENSASASEILAGVLQDYDRAVLIGKNTYGKGLIQQNYDLSNSGSINLSIGEYVLPGGRTISKATDIPDSTFKSLTNSRTLHHGRGVPVDLELEDCESEVNLDSLRRSITIQNSIWNTLPDYDILDKLITEKFTEAQELKCGQYSKADMIWDIAKNCTQNGKQLDIQYLDQHIKKAFELLHSDEFNEILKGQDLSK